MNKAKALFAAGMIVVVAGASGTAWILNEKGIIGDGVSEQYVEEFFDEDADENDADIKDNGNDKNNEKDEKPADKETENVSTNETTTENETKKPADETTKAETETKKNEVKTENEEINEFLSNFSKVYFAEHGEAFSQKSFSGYELVRFAYSHLMRTDKSAIVLKEKDDDIKYYNAVSYKKINAVLNELLDVSVSPESVKSKNSDAFFDYENGYFYTPATDGMVYINYVIADSVKKEDNRFRVQFTVFSGDVPYADGEAKIVKENGTMKLEYYKIYK